MAPDLVEITETDVAAAEAQMTERRAATPYAVGASYDRRIGRVRVELSNGVELAFPPRLAQGLESARPADLATIDISPTGLGLHFPRLDADLYVPALLEGVFGSPAWTAARMGRTGGRASSPAKAAAARQRAAGRATAPSGRRLSFTSRARAEQESSEIEPWPPRPTARPG